MKQPLLLIGTGQGAFLASADLNRKNRQLKGPFLARLEINHMTADDRPKSSTPDAATSPVTRTALL